MQRLSIVLCLMLATLCCSHADNDESIVAVAPRPDSDSYIVLLGTGTPNADPERSGPAVAIIVSGTPYLVDCGPGVVRRAAAAKRRGWNALAVTNLTTLFVTHLHSDHTLGYPDLIFTPWVLGRERPLSVFGPPGISAMTDHILAAYREDIRIRLDGLEPANSLGYKVQANEIAPGTVYTDDNVTVRAFSVPHGSWKHSFGYRFETADRVIVVSGDTTPSDILVRNAQGCDVLIHEVYSQVGFERRPPEWQEYHSQFHTSTVELAAIANRVRPKLLVLYHQLLWGETPEDLVNEIRAHYDGAVVFGNDLDSY